MFGKEYKAKNGKKLDSLVVWKEAALMSRNCQKSLKLSAFKGTKVLKNLK